MGVQEGDKVVTQPPIQQNMDQISVDEGSVPVSDMINNETDIVQISPKTENQVRVLKLNHQEHQESVLYRLQKGWILQLRPGPTMFGRTVSVFTNHPKDKNDVFIRTKYRRLQWLTDTQNKGDDTAFYVEINIIISGSFYYYFTYDGTEDLDHAQGSGYFLVDPTLEFGSSKEILPQDCIQCQTVISKCLGPFPQWEDRLKVAKEAGYNMLHFTPVQELGLSQSSYSLFDQLQINSSFSTKNHSTNLKHIQELVKKMADQWKMLSLVDIVLNHTANNSAWLKDHPESTYNVFNSCHLRPAYLLDRILYKLTIEVSDNKWQHKGIPKELNKEEHVEALKQLLYGGYLQEGSLHEFYLLNIEKIVEEFRSTIKNQVPHSLEGGKHQNEEELKLLFDAKFRRNSSTVDMDVATKLFNLSWSDESDENSRINKCCDKFRQKLEELNHHQYNIIQGYINSAIECCIGTVRYDRLQHDGPKLTEVSKKKPLVPQYFTHCGSDSLTFEEDEKLTFTDESQYMMAHNGWVMGDDPLNDFAKSTSNVYLQRTLIAWGDSVKLRYGDRPEDSKYLWDRMRSYVEDMAKTFHGIRLDNCHSTPIHVAEYLLDAARRIRPDLYVIAELFTNSDQTDNIFVNRLGINSLIREALSAPNSHEEGRLVFLYGGEPVGAFILPPVRPLVPSIAHAILMDMSHDNQSPINTRTPWDLLPSSSLVSMACCATGSTRGYDEYVPHHINVVSEIRLYNSWVDSLECQPGQINDKSGIMRCRKLINDLHMELGLNGYNQIFVDQVTSHVVTVTRHNPVTHQSVILVAYTSFVNPCDISNEFIRPLKVQGKLEEIIFEFRSKQNDEGGLGSDSISGFIRHPEFINGLQDMAIEIKEGLHPSKSSLVKLLSDENATSVELEYKNEFRPGSVIAFRFSLQPAAQTAVNQIRNILSDFGYKKRISEVISHNSDLISILKDLNLSDLNYVLFRCDQEEKDEGKGGGIYHVNNCKPMPYCGLQGFISMFSEIRAHNDLGHPICGNLRDGDWMPQYIINRLKLNQRTEKLAKWLDDVFNWLKDVPRYLIPAYFDSILTSVYLTLVNHAWSSMGNFISDGSDFAKALGLCSVQFCGVVRSALLPPLSPNLQSPQPPVITNSEGKQIEASVSLSAGLPHFCCGYMRSWGRDTFIALPGNLLITGRYNEARWIILSFASTLRHGLIPNLLDGGVNARYNCRDAVWWWFFSIQQYVSMVPEGHKILKDKVSRMYPTDDSLPQQSGLKEENLEDTMQEALQRHFQGIKFRERNAGYKIDSQMKDEGFNIEIGVNLDTGFPFGGNSFNCGTWMDKMGSSEIAGTKGIPATPRDGSAVEIVGLCKAALKFLNTMNKESKYSFNTVEKIDSEGNTLKWTFENWERKIADNFEEQFWINDIIGSKNEQKTELINRRGIYKDTVNSSADWADLQLRPNFTIAIAVAPEMVNPRNAWLALQNAEEILLSPLGIKTLDPSDWGYRGNYDNSNDSSDPKLARGNNYHQGPEWLWPVGWLLKAQLAIAYNVGGSEQVINSTNNIKARLSAHYTHLLNDIWRSLPELTNANAAHCNDSNPAQSWSTGTLLEVLWQLDQLEKYQ